MKCLSSWTSIKYISNHSFFLLCEMHKGISSLLPIGSIIMLREKMLSLNYYKRKGVGLESRLHGKEHFYRGPEPGLVCSPHRAAHKYL